MPARRPDYRRGGFYHLYNRGAHRVSLFVETDNYVFVLRKMKTACRALGLAPIAYCLLPNHYHWLIRQDGEAPAGPLPQRVFNSYSKAYNRRYEHSGTLFEGKYRVRAVEEEGYLLQLCGYIHANPVIHGVAARPADWPYSNYLEWVGKRQGTLVDQDLVREYFPDAEGYRRFVEEYAAGRRTRKGLEVYLSEWER